MNKIELPEFTITGIEQIMPWSLGQEPTGVRLKLDSTNVNLGYRHNFDVEFTPGSAKDFRIGQKVKVSFEFGE